MPHYTYWVSYWSVGPQIYNSGWVKWWLMNKSWKCHEQVMKQIWTCFGLIMTIFQVPSRLRIIFRFDLNVVCILNHRVFYFRHGSPPTHTQTGLWCDTSPHRGLCQRLILDYAHRYRTSTLIMVPINFWQNSDPFKSIFCKSLKVSIANLSN